VVSPSANQVTQGNPDLKPTTANSFDFAIENYLSEAGIFSVGIFNKQISNYIANSISNQTFPNNGLFAGFVGVAHVISYANIEKAYARGLEFNYQQKLKNIPEVLKGLGFGLNYTYVDSKFEIRPGEFSKLPSTSTNTANASISYEKNGFDMRIAGYYLSQNLWAIGNGLNTPDVFSQPRFSLDLGSSYAVSKNTSIYLNAKNLTNTPLTFVEGSSERVIQREFYGPTIQIGVNLRY
jgi:TonB-dependent receptor